MDEWKIGSTANPNDFGFAIGWAPQYTQPIHVIDSLASTLRADRRDRWRQLRDAALALWRESTGLIFGTAQGEPITWANGYMDPMWPNYYTQDAITFVRLVPGEQYGYGAWAPHLPPSGGLVGLALKRFPDWWEGYRFREIRTTIAHEVGHALGFGHGGDGIMMGRLKPSEEEVESVKAHYNLP